MSEVSSWFGGLPRVLFVHAHPDDETIATGGTLAALAEAGREPLLITLTRGERGEVVAGPLQALVEANGLAVVRQNELKNALAMLGVERHVFLGVEPARAEGLSPTIYEDSGMSWAADGLAVAAEDVGVDALTSVPAVEVLNDLLVGAALAGAQAIVSYDDGGGYGHPDHVLAHQISRAVAVALELPFWHIVSVEPGETERSSLNTETLDDQKIDVEEIDDEEVDDATLTVETHDVTPWLDRKIAALRSHTTQLTVEDNEIVHVGGQRQPVGTVESFARLI